MMDWATMGRAVIVGIGRGAQCWLVGLAMAGRDWRWPVGIGDGRWDRRWPMVAGLTSRRPTLAGRGGVDAQEVGVVREEQPKEERLRDCFSLNNGWL